MTSYRSNSLIFAGFWADDVSEVPCPCEQGFARTHAWLGPVGLAPSLPATPGAPTNAPVFGYFGRSVVLCLRAINSIPFPVPRLREYFRSAALFQCSWTPKLCSGVPSPSGS